MAEAEGLLLADEINVGHVGDAETLFQHFLLAGGSQLLFQLRSTVKVVFDDALVAAQNDQDIGDAGAHRLFHEVLDGGLVHDGQHTLGHGLGGGQHAGAEARSGDDGFRDVLHDSFSFKYVSGWVHQP